VAREAPVEVSPDSANLSPLTYPVPPDPGLSPVPIPVTVPAIGAVYLTGNALSFEVLANFGGMVGSSENGYRRTFCQVAQRPTSA
jgi:hypothetical protein